MTVIRILCI